MYLWDGSEGPADYQYSVATHTYTSQSAIYLQYLLHILYFDSKMEKVRSNRAREGLLSYVAMYSIQLDPIARVSLCMMLLT